MSYNLWLYVNGNPINFADPSGTQGCKPGQHCPNNPRRGGRIVVPLPTPTPQPTNNTNNEYYVATLNYLTTQNAGVIITSPLSTSTPEGMMLRSGSNKLGEIVELGNIVFIVGGSNAVRNFSAFKFEPQEGSGGAFGLMGLEEGGSVDYSTTYQIAVYENGMTLIIHEKIDLTSPPQDEIIFHSSFIAVSAYQDIRYEMSNLSTGYTGNASKTNLQTFVFYGTMNKVSQGVSNILLYCNNGYSPASRYQYPIFNISGFFKYFGL
jgi:hypothetical protein